MKYLGNKIFFVLFRLVVLSGAIQVGLIVINLYWVMQQIRNIYPLWITLLRKQYICNWVTLVQQWAFAQIFLFRSCCADIFTSINYCSYSSNCCVLSDDIVVGCTRQRNANLPSNCHSTQLVHDSKLLFSLCIISGREVFKAKIRSDTEDISCG